MKKRDKEFVLIVSLLLIIIGLLIYIAMTLPDKAATCLFHPIEYYEYQENVSCFCNNFNLSYD